MRPIAIESDRLFVQIASYRDRECQWTIRDAFARAKHPARIFVGVCWQYDPDADSSCFEYEPDPSHVRRIDFHARDARGLGWARAQAQSLWRGEEFTLQIDSHMRFVQDWDVLLLQELEACPSAWPVLTMYPAPYWPPDRLEDKLDPLPAVQGVKGFNAAGMLQFTLQWAPPEVPIESPKPTAALAGGFVFGPSRMITDVPSDPQIYFEGEEPSLAVRLYTHGFDLFTPRRTIVYHYYRRSDSRRPWDDMSSAEPDTASRQRIRQLVEPGPGDPDALGRFGLGRVRSLADYELFAGVDFRSRSVATYAYHYPFVHTDEVVEALIADVRHRPEDGAELFLLDGEGFLFAKTRSAFLQLSREATFCWCALEEGMTVDELVSTFAERAGIESSTARRHVGVLLCHWQTAGLLSGYNRAATAPTESPIHRQALLPPAGAPRIESAFRTLGRGVRIRCYSDDDAAIIAPVINHLADASPEGEAETGSLIDIVGVGTWRYVATDEAFPATVVASPQDLAAAIVQALQTVGQRSPSALIHLQGAIVEDDSGATLLTGDTEWTARLAIALGASPFDGRGGLAGKCEAAAPGLVARALVQVNVDGSVQTVPQPMLVPEGMIHELRVGGPELEELPLRSGFPWGPTVIPPYEGSAGRAPRRVDRILIVDQTPAGENELTPVGAAEVLRHIIAVATAEPALNDADRAAALVAWAERTPAQRLRIADLHGGITALRAATSGSRPASGPVELHGDPPPALPTLPPSGLDWPVEVRSLRMRGLPDHVRKFLFRPSSECDLRVIRQAFDNAGYELDDLRQTRGLDAYLRARAEEGSRPLVVDVGAKIGASAVCFADRFPGSRVVAIEPERRNLELLEWNTQGLDVTVIDGAIGPRVGTAFVTYPGEGDGGFTLSADTGRYPVPVMTIDEILDDPRQAGTVPALCKIDMRDGESDLFGDHPSWVDRFPLLIIDLHDRGYGGQGVSSSVLRALADREFDIVIRPANICCFSHRLLGRH